MGTMVVFKWILVEFDKGWEPVSFRLEVRTLGDFSAVFSCGPYGVEVIEVWDPCRWILTPFMNEKSYVFAPRDRLEIPTVYIVKNTIEPLA